MLAIGVEREWRGCGVGGALMKALLDAARDTGVDRIDLTTGSFNEAGVRLYRSSGFVEIARVRVDDNSDAMRMRAHLRHAE